MRRPGQEACHLPPCSCSGNWNKTAASLHIYRYSGTIAEHYPHHWCGTYSCSVHSFSSNASPPISLRGMSQQQWSVLIWFHWLAIALFYLNVTIQMEQTEHLVFEELTSIKITFIAWMIQCLQKCLRLLITGIYLHVVDFMLLCTVVSICLCTSVLHCIICIPLHCSALVLYGLPTLRDCKTVLPIVFSCMWLSVYIVSSANSLVPNLYQPSTVVLVFSAGRNMKGHSYITGELVSEVLIWKLGLHAWGCTCFHIKSSLLSIHRWRGVQSNLWTKDTLGTINSAVVSL